MTKKKNTDIVPVDVSKEVEKAILEKHKAKLEEHVKKLTLKYQTEQQLQTQAALSEDQKSAIHLLSEGYTTDETARKVGVTEDAIFAWLAQSNFARAMQEATVKGGLSDRGNRIRTTKRIAQKINDKLAEKLDEDDYLDSISPQMLSQLALIWQQRMDVLIDKNEDKNVNDLAQLIVTYMRSVGGKSHATLEDFLNDDEYKYPTVDAEAVEVINE